MLTQAPLPKLKHLLLAVFKSAPSDDQLSACWQTPGGKSFWLSRSSWALKAIVLWWEKTFDRAPIIWFPDYFCNEALSLVRTTSATIKFYSVDKNLMPKWDVCHALAKTAKPDIFVLVHYFGQPSDLVGAKQFCEAYQSLIIEDAAHVLCPTADIGSVGHFTLYSPHKLLAVPHGSICVMSPKKIKRLYPSPSNSAGIMTNVIEGFGHHAPAVFPWILKRLIQKVVPSFFIYRKTPVQTSVQCCSTLPALHPFIKKLLYIELREMSAVEKWRRENRQFYDMLINLEGNGSLIGDDKHIPYLAVFTGIEQHGFNKALTYLMQKWPDLPPEVVHEPLLHADAIQFYSSMIAFPVHQSLTLSHYFKHYLKKNIKSKLKRILPLYSLRQDHPDEYKKLFHHVPYSNLLQSSLYGEAKHHAEAWDVSHLIILKNKMPLAICQLLQKKLFGFFCLYRINRGPVWLSSSVGYFDKIACLSLLKKRFSGIFSRKILSIAPELSENIDHYYLLSLLGYHHVKKQPYSSAMIDLSQSEDFLRKQLSGKWRNQLCSAEKLDILIEIESGIDALMWLLKKYHEFKKSKDFSGVSEKLIHYMAQQSFDPECFVTLRASYQDEYVAGILVYRHGQTATYFIGWNGEVGRKIYSNNLLLWRAILELKSIHCSYFDLGGIDAKNTQAISHFKQGVRGKDYSLLGEFVCL